MKPKFKRMMQAALELRGIENQAELARRLGLNDQIVTNWKARDVPSRQVVRIAKELGCDATWLETGEGEMRRQYPTALAREMDENPHAVYEKIAAMQSGAKYNVNDGPDIRGNVPLISWVQAGCWNYVQDNLHVGDGEIIQTTYRARRHTYALRVKGDSMEPKFPDGCTIIVEPEETPIHGSFVVVRQNGDTEATFKQLVIDGGKSFLKPINARYPIMELLDDAVFCGVVKKMEMDV